MQKKQVPKDLTIPQHFALVQEVETGSFLLVEGLIALNGLSAANDFAHLPLQLLGQGFERLFKVVICLADFHLKGELPRKRDVQTHDLRRLLARVLEVAEAGDYGGSRPAAAEDVAFLRSDELFSTLIDVMSNFGSGGRYYDLDSLLDPESASSREPPQSGFHQIENMILRAHPDWEAQLGTSAFSGFYLVLNAELTSVVQRAARGLSRMFVWGLLGPLAKQVSGNLFTFLMLRDDQLDAVPRRWHER